MYMLPHRGWNTLMKELMDITHVMQNSSNELTTLVSVSIKCKQIETFNTYVKLSCLHWDYWWLLSG